MRHTNAPLFRSLTVKIRRLRCSRFLVAALALQMPAQAQDMPAISPSLKQALGDLPIADMKSELQGMVGALKKTPCGGSLKGCYMTHSGPVQLYFFTSNQAQQTLLLVVDKTMPLPHLLGKKVQKVMGDTSLSSPIISISTTDYDLASIKMPPALQKVVREKYFNVNSLSFSSGVQLAARATLGGEIKKVMHDFGVKADQVTMRAAVVLPIPLDVTDGAAAGAGMASAIADGATMAQAGADAMSPEAFVEFQFAPGARLPLLLPPITLSDATFFINNALIVGYKGNAAFKGAGDKKFLIQFQTPLTPAGEMPLSDFGYRIATPAQFTLEDAAHVIASMASPDPRLAQYGGGLVGGINSYKPQLLEAAKTLSMFQLRNPNPAPEYRFGDNTKPWPDDNKYFNMASLGPLADNGPYWANSSETVFLGQKILRMEYTAGFNGFYGSVGQNVTFKLGPLGKVTFNMTTSTKVTPTTMEYGMSGNFAGQKVAVILGATKATIAVNASCVNPFEIKASVTLTPDLNIADVFASQGGANVDPAKISGCVGKELEAAYNKIAGEYKNLSGYTASAANAELKKISNAAVAGYNETKKQARKAAETSLNAATKAWSGGTNAAISAVGGHTGKPADSSNMHYDRSVFDWDYYYDKNPNLVAKKTDLVAHWDKTGYPKKWRGSLEFDMAFYAKDPELVKWFGTNASAENLVSGWLAFGFSKGRQGSADFDVASYLARHPDLITAFGATNYEAAFLHWLDHGKAEGRDGSPGPAAQVLPKGMVRIGGGGGRAWEDGLTCKGQYVTGFRLCTGKRVDCVQFKYPGGWAPHQQGNGKVKTDVSLAAGEYVVQVDYRAGSSVDSLTFKTNKGKTYGPYGGGGGTAGTYNVPSGQKLACMAGRAGSEVDQLTFSSTGPR